MGYTSRIKPISYLKAHSAELIRELGDGAAPLIVVGEGPRELDGAPAEHCDRRTGRVELPDGAVPGLTLRIGKTRGATWSLTIRVFGEGGITDRGQATLFAGVQQLPGAVEELQDALARFR